ncbi:DMT family transporter [Haloferax namakaokahaiae]|uniref:DMT family transporter n=1 Tax=Haloferax namakaokahaiae TaxID=1748331 RepID=A0ABD5ZBN8_9EURY
MTHTSSSHRNFALFSLLAVLWGTSFMAIEVGLDVLPPALFAALRYDIAGAVLFVYGLLAAEDWRPRGRDEWVVVLVGGALLIGTHFTLLFSGQRYVTSGVAAIVLSLTPVLTPVFAWSLLPEERLDLTGFVGVFLGLVGTVVIALSSGSVGGQLVGVVLLFLAAVAWAFGSVLVKRLPGNPPVVPMQAWMMLLGSGMLHAVSPALGEPGLESVARSPLVVAALLFLAVLCSAVGFLIYFVLLDELGAVEISLVNYAVPVVAAISGWAFLGEHVGPATITGFVLILVGFGFMKRDALEPRLVRLGIRSGLVSPEASNRGHAPADD